MMTEISLNVLDVAQNSVRANATQIEIQVIASHTSDTLTISIKDNGCGMSKDQISRVEDPFFTTRTTRRLGFGIPFFKFAAECTNGSFQIASTEGVGTTVTAIFTLSHIDRMPLGDMTETIHMLITQNTTIDFLYTYHIDGREFLLDTREFREILGELPFDAPEISAYIKEYLETNKTEVDQGMIL